ncbi:hypothetical protein scyTo_0008040 [Scyliorhinus torazame]|uniref:Uncharacterized protein n=1 Tax=Scyliorhinus torazame TaxID=75743 RepID=A0A401P2M5_SCYTO|nr:hypothetical protein [Scyliorhinus torazame]
MLERLYLPGGQPSLRGALLSLEPARPTVNHGFPHRACATFPAVSEPHVISVGQPALIGREPERRSLIKKKGRHWRKSEEERAGERKSGREFLFLPKQDVYFEELLESVMFSI